MAFDPSRARRSAEMRQTDIAKALPKTLTAALAAPGWRRHLGTIDPVSITDRAALARLPLLRKSDLPAAQKAEPPFGGFINGDLGQFGRLFTSPGPIFEPEGRAEDVWRIAAALEAIGVKPGDIALNTLSYHLTPGGFIMDSGARAFGCPVIPAGPGNTEQTLEVVEHFRPSLYCGTPDFLKILLDKAAETGRDASSLRRALVSGAAFPPSLQAEIAARGIDAYQAYATADLGCVAYETTARDGMVVSEDVILEIVRPGTGDPVPDGEVGEVVVTSLDPHHPLIRLALGDLSMILPGPSASGHTNIRIKGWMGRADQTAKVKGMFVRPEQIAQLRERHTELGRLRVVITRKDEQDAMTLLAESTENSEALAAALGNSLVAITKLKGRIELVAPGSLPNDGKVISDERPVG